MGRYLCCGVVIDIHLFKKMNYNGFSHFDIIKNRDRIEKELGDILDLSVYQYKKVSNEEIQYSIKREYFEENIHAIIDEVYTFGGLYCTFREDFRQRFANGIMPLGRDFNRDKFPIHLLIYDENYFYGNERLKAEKLGKYYTLVNGDLDVLPVEYDGLIGSEYHLFWGDLMRKVRGNITYVRLWWSIDKIFSEDYSYLTKIINRISREYFKSPLGKNVLFFITE